MESKGISPVIASILMLMIVIALATAAYLYISGAFTGKVATSFSIVESYNDTITIRNDGTNPITSFTKVSVDGNPATYLVIPQDPGLVGYWKFDEGSGEVARDSSGYNNHGTLNNFNWDATSGWTDGKYGKALRFDGVNDYVSVPDDPSLNPTTAITITAWIYPKGWGENDYGRIVHKALPKEGYLFYLTNSGHTSDDRNSIVFYMFNPAGNKFRVVAPAYSITLEKWQFVAATYDRSYVKIYVNGTLTKTFNATDAISTTTAPLYIGNRYWTERTFDGIIDELRIYNRALTAEEIKALFNIGSIINPGQTATIKIYNIPSKGTHTLRLCTASMCTTGYLTII